MTGRELRTEIEKKVGSLDEKQWAKLLAPESPADFYDDLDLKERLIKAKDRGFRQRKLNLESKIDGLSIKIPLSPPWEKEFKELSVRIPLSHIQKSEEMIKAVELRAEKFRTFLGLKNPLKPRELNPWLENTFIKPLEPFSLFPEFLFTIPNSINHQALKPEWREKIIELEREIDIFAQRVPWSKEQIVNFILCRTKPLLPYLEVNGDFYLGDEDLFPPKIEIRVYDLTIPAETIREIYQSMRREILKRSSKTSTSKPRAQSDITTELLQFVDDNKGLSWAEKLKLWNKQHPKIKYASGRSMSITVYKARKKRI